MINIISIIIGIIGIIIGIVFPILSWKRDYTNIAKYLNKSVFDNIISKIAQGFDPVVGADEVSLRKLFDEIQVESKHFGIVFKNTSKYIEDFYYKKYLPMFEKLSGLYSGYTFLHVISDSTFNEKDKNIENWESLRKEFNNNINEYILRDIIHRS